METDSMDLWPMQIIQQLKKLESNNLFFRVHMLRPHIDAQNCSALSK